MFAKAWVWLLCIFLSACNKAPTLIVIHTTQSWMGHSDPRTTSWVRVERKNGKYVAQNLDAENREIPDEQVTAFLAALDARTEGSVSFSNLGITQTWLDQNAEPAFGEYFNGRTRCIAPSQRELFISRFRNASAIGKAVGAYFESSWTDDFPWTHVEIYERARGRVILLESSQLHAFMIPWTIIENGRGRLSFNANISRTLNAFLAENAVLKQRIAGTDFRRGLSESLYKQMCPAWRKLDRNPGSWRLYGEYLRWYPPNPGCEPPPFDSCYLPGNLQ